jgi:sensor c-di-GMP phosphodiesterase-like protein
MSPRGSILASITAFFIADSRRRLAVAVVWVLAFVAMLGLSGWIGHNGIARSVEEKASEELSRYTELNRNVIATFAFMHANMSAEPCTEAFQEQLRVVAYLPDGLNEFLYAPGGVAHCTVSEFHLPEPVAFGTPDVPAEANSGRPIWFDRDLAFVGMPGLTGTIVGSEPYAVVVPPQEIEPVVPAWMRVEMGLAAEGTWWHRYGERGIQESYANSLQGGFPGLFASQFYRKNCDEDGVHCIVAEVDLGGLFRSLLAPLLVALIGAIAVASWAAHEALRCMRRYWSFESRFLRAFGPESVVCTYQPFLKVSDGGICGCEVLVRWRDLDGSIVTPDRFLPIVERNDLTFRLTEIVVAKAFEELISLARRDRPLQVSFNIFPRDLDHAKLIPLFSGFLEDRERFSVVVEVIESEAMPLDQAQAEIEALLAAGIFTHIDDFGVGYSNIHNLAALSVHAVKVDRAFAMASEGTMLDRMLLPAIAMIRTCGHLVCVEGVESAERLRLLSNGEIGADFVQGYHVSRPLPVDQFRQFLRDARELPDRFGVAA